MKSTNWEETDEDYSFMLVLRRGREHGARLWRVAGFSLARRGLPGVRHGIQA